jgi:hypothetical protein
LALVLALAGAIGCGGLPAADVVVDLRLLGMRAEPPDQVLVLYPDGGGLPSLPITLTALVANPDAGNTPISWEWDVCAILNTSTTPAASPINNTVTNSCLPNSPGFATLATGTVTAPNGWTEVSTTFTASTALLTQAIALDPYHGLDGLWLPVQLSLTMGSQSVVGDKYVVYTPPFPGITYVPAKNPILSGVSVDGVVWPDAGVLALSGANMPDGGFEVLPLFDAGQEVSYTEPSFTGQPLTFTESWRFDFFGTMGDFNPSDTGGTSPILGDVQNALDSRWKPPQGTPEQDVLFWMVTRTGRGGESWLARTAHYTP